MYAGALLAVTTLSICVQGFQLWSLCLIVIALLALNAVGLIRAFDRSEGLAPGSAGLVLAGITVWLFVSAQLSQLESIAALGLYQQLTLPLAFLAFLLAPDKERLWNWLRTFSGIASGLLAVAALAEPAYREIATYSAVFVQRNSLSGFLLLLTFILLPALHRALSNVINRRRTVAVWSIPVFLSLFTVSFSTSRAAIGAFVVAFGGFYLSLGHRDRDRLGKYVLALALWAFLLADVALKGNVGESMQSVQLVSTQLLEAEHAFWDDEFSVGANGEPLSSLSPMMRSKIASANERFLIWRASLDMVADLPWSGFGPGTFRSVYPSFGYAADRSSRNYAHNDYLQIYAELGAIGAVLCFMLGGSVVWRWFRYFQRPKSRYGHIEVNTVFWGMLAVGAQSFFTYNFFVPATLVMFGLVLARFVSITGSTRTPHLAMPIQRFHRRTVVFIMLVLASIPTITLTSATAMSIFHERGLSDLDAGLLADAQSALTIAARLHPNATTETARAQVYLAASEAAPTQANKWKYFDLAADHAARASSMNAYSAEAAHAMILLAIYDLRLDPGARLAAVAAAYRETLRRDQRYFPVRIELARFLLQSGRDMRALAILEAGLRYPIPGDTRVFDYLTMLRDLRQKAGNAAGARAADREIERVQRLLGAAS